MNIDGHRALLIDATPNPNTLREEHRARLYVCGYAHHTDEARRFLDMLGLAVA